MKFIELFKKYRHSVLVVADICIVIASYFFAIFFMNLKIDDLINLSKEILIAVCVYELFLNIFQMYKNMLRYEIGKDYIKYMFSCFLSVIVMSILSYILKLEYMGIRINTLAGIFIAGMFVMYRLAGRSILSRRLAIINRKKFDEDALSKEQKRLLIIGAGMGAREIIIAIKNSMKDKYNIIGIIDDNTNKLNHSILGVPVIGTRYDIPEIVKIKNIELIFFAINRIFIIFLRKCKKTFPKYSKI